MHVFFTATLAFVAAVSVGYLPQIALLVLDGATQEFGGYVPLKLRRHVEGMGIRLFEQNRLPDPVVRFGVRTMLAQRLREQRFGNISAEQEYKRSFVADLRSRGIAEFTADANEQHYEVDTRFYNIVLGQRQKYSSGLYPPNTPVHRAAELLDEAEDRMLHLYAERSQIASACSDPQRKQKLRLMDLGCGWGSVSLWFAATFSDCLDVVGLSNSRTQRTYIMGEAKRRGLTNVDVMTGDIVKFELPSDVKPFDRVISIEMFEHMKNYELLLRKVSTFLQPSGMLFVHIFSHRKTPYHFENTGDPSDWMSRYFFRGGTMPSDDLFFYFPNDLRIADHWTLSGRHYMLTLEAWLQRMDASMAQVKPVLADTYGKDENTVMLWTVRWRAFFIACSELFGYNNGNEWVVSHYLFAKPAKSVIG